MATQLSAKKGHQAFWDDPACAQLRKYPILTPLKM
jgi:hypothetical protein